MSDDDLLWDFFSKVPSEGYEIEGCHCVSNGCNGYKGTIDPSNIWMFDLTSHDGKVTQKVKTSIVNLSEPRMRFNFENQEGKAIALEMSPENCKVTEDGFLRISQSDQDHEFTIEIRKV